MNDRQRLRSAAQALVDQVDPLLVPWRDLEAWRKLRDALADSPEESEMERLREWLGSERGKAEAGRDSAVNNALRDHYSYRAYFLGEILDHIQSEFLGGEEPSSEAEDMPWGERPDCMP